MSFDHFLYSCTVASQLLKGTELKGPQHTSWGHLFQPQGRDEVPSLDLHSRNCFHLLQDG